MRKQGWMAALCALLMICAGLLPVRAAVPDPARIEGEAALLMDAATGQVLYEKNGYARMAPASLTKILTGLIALEELDEEMMVVASEKAVRQPRAGTSAGIGAGEALPVSELLYAMLLPSANEAANILAEAVDGSTALFAERMNRRARELGARDTRFANPSGLPARGREHHTTAYDLAVITRAAMETPGFLDYFGAGSHTIPATDLSEPRALTHTHAMLQTDSRRFHPEVLGGKTGYTDQAGYTLVTVAERDGRRLICVLLNSDNYYEDTLALLEFGFGEFSPCSFTLREREPATVPIVSGDRLAGMVYLSRAGQVELLLHESVDPAAVQPVWSYPDRLAVGGELEAGVELRLPPDRAEGLPETTLTLAFEQRTAIFAPPLVEVAAVPPPEEGWGMAEPTERLVLGLALCAALAVVGACALLGRRRSGYVQFGRVF